MVGVGGDLEYIKESQQHCFIITFVKNTIIMATRKEIKHSRASDFVMRTLSDFVIRTLSFIFRNENTLIHHLPVLRQTVMRALVSPWLGRA